MSEPMSDEEFIRALQELWRDCGEGRREELRNLLEGHYDEGERAYRLIEKMETME